MADGLIGGGLLKGKVSEDEWKVRVDLAALYRLVGARGGDDLIYTHISARIPGPEHHVLINPYGMFFEEMTASSMVKIDLDGNILQDTPYHVNAAGFTIHSAVHAARDDAHYVIHVHTDQGVAVSAQAEGLLPLTQHALITLPRLAYHDYEGIALDLDERDRLVHDLGDKSVMLLRNHGTLAAPRRTAAAAWNNMFFLERACAQQVMALSIGRDKVLMAPQAAQEKVAGQGRGRATNAPREPRNDEGAVAAAMGSLLWPACLRRLDRELPGYDA